MPSIALSKIVADANRLLKIDQIPDYPPAHNGLQLENTSRKVSRIAAAVDSHLGIIEQAVAAQADLLIVHHGLFWTPPVPLTGVAYQKITTALDGGLAVYSAHLPLDAHPILGNNALLAKRLGLKKPQPFLPYQGVPIGMKFAVQRERDALVAQLAKALQIPQREIHVMPFGPAKVRSLGICSGSSSVEKAAAEGVDTFITGEGPQHTYGLARELGVNLIYAGHYHTETLGVRALAERLAKKYKLPAPEFIDEPTGL